jgi:hypothetical protein
MTEAKAGASKNDAETTAAATALTDLDRLMGKLNKLDLNNNFRIPPSLFRSDVSVFLRQTNRWGV